MKLAFFPIIFFLSTISLGQTVKVATIKKANPITKEVYIFPKIIVSNSRLATQRINNNLREYVLWIDQNTKDENIFDSVWRTDYRTENISDLSFKVSQANASLVSLTISGQGCGAYCEPFNYYFTFNAKTGNLLTLDSLFSGQGLKSL